jgi:NADPH2:quinone reductase
MRVAQVTQFGAPEVLQVAEMPEPVAGAGQVVIDVAVADVLFFETQVRRGLGGEHFPVRPPYVPGAGVAGRVLTVGPGVDPAWVGKAVAARVDGGGYAQRVAVSADVLVAVPAGLELTEAAALLHDGATALALFDNAQVKAGERVLVTAAAGGLGLLLVQLAHDAGAQVIAAARGQDKLDAADKAGAEVVVDYSEPGWADRVLESTGGAGVDVTFDGAGGQIGHVAYTVTARGGRVSAHGAPGGFLAVDAEEARRRGVTVRGIEQAQFSPEVATRLIERAFAAAVQGRLSPVIGKTVTLERAAQAHAAIEDRAVVGKTLLLVGERA